MTDALERLARDLLVDDPITWSSEGLDDACFFCGADKAYRRGGRYDQPHEPDCDWLRGRQMLGLPLSMPDRFDATRTVTHVSEPITVRPSSSPGAALQEDPQT